MQTQCEFYTIFGTCTHRNVGKWIAFAGSWDPAICFQHVSVCA